MYNDTIVHDPRVLRFVVDMVGADRIMMGSDMPFPIGDLEPMKIVAERGLRPRAGGVINGGLAQSCSACDQRLTRSAQHIEGGRS